MVIEVGEETRKLLIEYGHGQEDWIMPNIIHESRNNGGSGIWMFKKVLRHRTGDCGKVEVEIK